MLGKEKEKPFSLRRRLARSSGAPNARRCCACWGGSEAERNKKMVFDSGSAKYKLTFRSPNVCTFTLTFNYTRIGPGRSPRELRGEFYFALYRNHATVYLKYRYK